MDDSRLPGVQGHTQLGQYPRGRLQCRMGLPARAARDEPSRPHTGSTGSRGGASPNQTGQQDIAQQRRNDAALRSAPLGRQPLSFGHHPGREHLPEQAQHATVRDSLVDQCKELLVSTDPKKSLRSASTTHSYPRPVPSISCAGLRGRTSAPVPVVGIIESRLEESAPAGSASLLTHPIEIVGMPSGRNFPGWPPWESALENRLRHILSVPQLPVQTIEIHIERCLERRQVFSIHATGTPVALHLLPGHLQILPPVHLVHQ